MKKTISLFVLVNLISQVLFAQQVVTLKNILLPSPEATAFIKYGMYPISTYTGKPDITVPIYEIKTANLSVPISLNYDATGMRVNDMATWVGMNWSLNAGGIISVMIVGKADIGPVPPRAGDIVNNETYFNYFKSLVDGVGGPSSADGEPDKYFFSFNGRSGSFVFDRNSNIMQIPKSSLKISIGSTGVFNIIDESGITYVFSIMENTESYIYSAAGRIADAKSNPFGSTYTNNKTAYYLSEIISSDGSDHIYFTYQNETTASKDDSYSETWGNKYPGGGEPQLPNTNYHEYRWTGVQRTSAAPRLKTISFSNGKVEFTRGSLRLDDYSSTLGEISIYQKNSNSTYSKLKSFKLNQSYYYNSDAYAQNSGLPNQTADRYRLRLDSIKLKDAVGNQVSGYTFSYNATNPPAKNSYAQDWYGYYNGAILNTTLVPPTKVFSGFEWITIGGADRSSNETSMKAGILEKITYPTGGYTLFETESHKLFETTSIVSEGSHVTALGQFSNNFVTESFTTPATLVTGSGKIYITLCPYPYYGTQPFVKIKNMSSGQEQTFTNPDYTQWYSAIVDYNFAAGTNYLITASCYVNQSNATAALNAYYYKTIPDPHNIPIGGLRIKSIKNYSSDNKLAYEENYKYGINENGAGVLTGIGGHANSYGRDQHIFHISGCGYSGGVYGVFQSGPLFDQCLTQGSPVVYTDVTKYVGTPTSSTGKTTYYYGSDFQQSVKTSPLPSGQELANNQGILIINDYWKRGQLLNQKEYRKNPDNSYSLVQETENTYNIFNTDTTYGLFAQTKFDRIKLLGWEQFCGAVEHFTDYAYAEYPVNTGYVQLAQAITKNYAPNGINFLQTIVNHSYDNIHKDIEAKSTVLNSKGETIETEKKYSFNKAQLLTPVTPAESLALDSMVTKNMLAPIEEITRNNNVQMLLKKTSYEHVNGSIIEPVNLKFQVKNNPLEARILFNKYDNYGNLLEQQKSGDVTEAYLWGYNGQYPVAKILNSSYDVAKTFITQSILDNPADDGTLRTNLNNLRSIPNAQVTTYTYKPLVGVSSQTDPNGRTIYYEYDLFNRLSLIRDKDNNIIKKICYNYAGQPEDCGVFLFYSAAKSGNFTRSNCAAGYSGTSYTYTVPANKYTSTADQATADQLAQNDVYANGQSQANIYGACNLSCMFSSKPGFSIPYSSLTNNSGIASFNLTFYPTSAAMNLYTTYDVAQIGGGCFPSSARTMTISTSGRTFVVTISSYGSVSVQLTSGSVSTYTTVSLSGTYNL